MHVIATARKIITLNDSQYEWVKTKIDVGYDTNVIEFIFRSDYTQRERINEVEMMIQILIAGQNSGEPRAFDEEAFSQRMQS